MTIGAGGFRRLDREEGRGKRGRGKREEGPWTKKEHGVILDV
jgi:hypothetical protein